MNELKLPGVRLVDGQDVRKLKCKGGRTIPIGDAAHANLPTAGQGASQGLEDAATVAYCLAKGDGNVRLALEVTQSPERAARCNPGDLAHIRRWDLMRNEDLAESSHRVARLGVRRRPDFRASFEPLARVRE